MPKFLKTDAHQLSAHGLNEQQFYNSGVFRGAIERIRGQFSATMRDKREFCRHVLNYMQDQGFTKGRRRCERRAFVGAVRW